MPDLRPTAVALVAAAALVAPAGAVDDAKPSPMPCGPNVKDSPSDSMNPQTEAKHDSLEILSFFFKHDPAKGAEATTANLVIKNLDEELPEATTSKHWTVEWVLGEKTYFVRAVIDYTGAISYEWGERIPETAAGNLPRYQYSGPTQGKLFPGAEGVVQLVIPSDIGGKAGSELKSWKASANGGYQVVPVAATTPTRGVSYAWDDVSGKAWVANACPAGSATAPPTTGTSSPSTKPSEQTGAAAPLPVTLTSKSVKAKSVKKKRLSLKLRSSEPITGLSAQLVRGRKVVGKGKLAKLSGSGTLKLTVRGKLAKGTYRLDLAGKDASGRHRTTAARLKVR